MEPSYLVENSMNGLSDLTLIIGTCYFDYTAFVFMKIILRHLSCIRLVIHLVIELFVIIAHLVHPRLVLQQYFLIPSDCFELFACQRPDYWVNASFTTFAISIAFASTGFTCY